MKYYITDAFTDENFKGNQAGVCILEKWTEDDLMQKIASENNLSETAFVVKRGEEYDLRWFTPEYEIDLCGHATLASAFIISEFYDKNIKTIKFNTKSGLLTVTKCGELLEMDFPSRMPEKVQITPLMEKALGVEVLEAHKSRDLLLLVKDEETVRHLNPDMKLLSEIKGVLGIIVTAEGQSTDFVSRFFAPNEGIPEDPVTGSAHSTLIPYWSKKLNKTDMVARQLSKRGGLLICRDDGERVKISGKAVLYLKGEIII